MKENITKGDIVLGALAQVGKDGNLRDAITEKLVEYETNFKEKETIRESITGPIVDAMNTNSGTIQKKLENGIIFEFIHQSKITRDFLLSNPKVPNHVWEPFTTKLLLLLSTNAKNVIVGGAYIGDHAVLIANNLKKNNGLCHAFEPNLISFGMLDKNKSLNNLPNLIGINKGLWSKNNTRLKIIGEDAYCHILELSDTDVTSPTDEIINSTTINDYCKDNKIASVDLIMLDIEGGEFMALKGANEILAMENAPNVVFEIHNSYVDWSNGLENADIIQYLHSFGYKCYAIRDFHSNFNIENHPIELIPATDVFLEGPPHGFNMLAIKDAKLIENDNFKICHNVSPKLLWNKNPELHHPLNWIHK